MGRMKELYIQIMEANDGIPEGMTVSDVIKMRELKIFNWQQYERQQEKDRLQHNQSKDPGEAAKIQQTEKKFRKALNEAKEEQRNKQ
jgi:rRNA maturation protein Rpf1